DMVSGDGVTEYGKGAGVTYLRKLARLHAEPLKEGRLCNVGGCRPCIGCTFHTLDTLPQFARVARYFCIILAESLGVHGVLEQVLDFLICWPDIAQPDVAVTPF